MAWGLRWSDDGMDVAALRTLADHVGERVSVPWTEHTRGAMDATDATEERAATGVLCCDALTTADARRLKRLGLDMVQVTVVGNGCSLHAGEDPGNDGELWAVSATRTAGSLAEAVRPVRVPGDPSVADGCLWIPADDRVATRWLGWLLALGRDDATVAEVTVEGTRMLVIAMASPPAYLLMRARDEPAEGVTAYGRVGDGTLWVQWGWAHPLGPSLGRALKAAARSAYVNATGRWHTTAALLPGRSVYDALVPRFDAARVDVHPAPGETRFTVRLRLAAGPLAEPELWLLDPAGFLSLEGLIDGLSTDEIARFTVARAVVSDTADVTYVLQELVRPNVPRLSTRVSDAVGAAGYVRAPGTDNLYLPVGQRLVPAMRLSELRTLLGLDVARAVVITQDSDGPRVVSIGAVDEVPLARWVDYVATDHRVELDRLEEETVFSLVVPRVEQPPRETLAERAARADEAPRPPRVARTRPVPMAVDDDIPVEIDDAVGDALAAVREEIRVLEARVADGGCDVAGTWQTLGELKARVGDMDEAAACLEAALFHGTPGEPGRGAVAALLVQQRGRLMGARGDMEELLDLAVRPVLGPGEAAYLGARVVDGVLRSEAPTEAPTEAPMEALIQQTVRVFLEPGTPVSRRLAWGVLSTVMRRGGDALGLTRAKERVLGALNDRGLSEAYDLPRFVRLTLALAGDTATGAEALAVRGRTEQVALLESLWQQASALHVRDLEPKGAYVRLILGVGFMRLGMPARARDLVEPVERELPVHELPNQALFGLYLARLAHVATQGDPTAWGREVDARLAAVKDARVKDRVEWLRKRSEWLRTATAEDLPPGLRGPLERELAEAEKSVSTLAPTLRRVMDKRHLDLFDFELTAAVERMVAAALRSGSDDAVAEVLAVALPQLAERIKILGHRARAIGACLRAAAALSDTESIHQLLNAVVTLADSPDVPSVRDLLAAVGPGLSALRRLGIGGSARRFLDSLVPVAMRAVTGGTQLKAALADGYLQVREPARAEGLLDEALDDTLEGTLEHPARFMAGAAALTSLRHWPMQARGPRCERVMGGLDRFADAFTASRYRLYETHKVLMLERLVDTVVDDVTVQSDRVRAYLEADELVVRRRILADWRDVWAR